MARVRNDETYALKRDSILDIAEQLVITKGYERLAISDLVAEAGISKGALYHYFGSKREVLAALLERRVLRWDARLAPIADSDLDAEPRLREFLRGLAGVKAEDREFLVEVLRRVYADENAIVYNGMRIAMADRMLPRLTMIISAGIDDGSFQVTDPEASARVVLSLLQECTDRIGRMLIDVADGVGKPRRIETQAAAYVDALHRTLDATPSSLDFLDTADLRRWVRAARRSRATASRKETP